MRRLLVLVCAAFTAGGFQPRVWCAPPRLRAASALLSGGAQDSDSIATGGTQGAAVGVARGGSIRLEVADADRDEETQLRPICMAAIEGAFAACAAAAEVHATGGERAAGEAVKMFSLYLTVHDDDFEDELASLFPAEQRSRVTYLADMLMMVCYLSPSDASSIASVFEWGGGSTLVGTWEQAIAEHADEGMRNAGLNAFLVPAYLHRDEALEAIKEDGRFLEYASPELRADRNVVLAAVRQAGLAIAYASPVLQADREVVLAAVRQNGMALRYASKEQRADCEVVLEAGRQNGKALQFASRELWADRGFFQEAVRQNGNALWYATEADPELEADREIVLAAVRQNGNAIRHASKELWVDREVVLEAVRQNGNTLRFVTEVDYKLKNDREVVLAAVAAQGCWEEKLGPNGQVVPHYGTPEFNDALMYASWELRADREVVLAAVQAHGLAIMDASEELQRDPEVFRVARVRRVENGYRGL